jgi:hypothetical protein
VLGISKKQKEQKKCFATWPMIWGFRLPARPDEIPP